MKGTTPTDREGGPNPGKKRKEERKYRIQRQGGKTGNILPKPDETTRVKTKGQRETGGTRPNGRPRH